MARGKWSALVFLLLTMSLATGSCTSKEPAEESGPPPEDKGRIAVETAMADWLPGNADEIAELLGPMVTKDLPIARDIATEAIRTALLTRYELSVEHVEDAGGTDAYSARVGITFPIVVKLPVLGEKEYLVRAAYDVTVKDGKVTESGFDASSVEVEEVSG